MPFLAGLGPSFLGLVWCRWLATACINDQMFFLCSTFFSRRLLLLENVLALLSGAQECRKLLEWLLKATGSFFELAFFRMYM